MKIEDGWNLGNDLETRRGGQNGKKWRGKDIAHGYWITGGVSRKREWPREVSSFSDPFTSIRNKVRGANVRKRRQIRTSWVCSLRCLAIQMEVSTKLPYHPVPSSQEPWEAETEPLPGADTVQLDRFAVLCVEKLAMLRGMGPLWLLESGQRLFITQGTSAPLPGLLNEYGDSVLHSALWQWQVARR